MFGLRGHIIHVSTTASNLSVHLVFLRRCSSLYSRDSSLEPPVCIFQVSLDVSMTNFTMKQVSSYSRKLKQPASPT